MPGDPLIADTEAILIMDPPGVRFALSRIASRDALIPRNAPFRFTLISLVHSSKETASSGLICATPALFTKDIETAELFKRIGNYGAPIVLIDDIQAFCHCLTSALGDLFGNCDCAVKIDVGSDDDGSVLGQSAARRRADSSASASHESYPPIKR